MTADWLKELAALDCGALLTDASLAARTTLRVGGVAQALLILERIEAVPKVLGVCQAAGVPWRFLGAGSNVLVTEGSLSGLTIATGRLRQVMVTGPVVEVAAGAALINVVSSGHGAGLTGMEWAGGIPATVGGAVVMNAGAHGGSISDHLVEALVVCDAQPARWIGASELAYGYRHSALIGSGQGVLAARFQLQRGDVAAARVRLAEALAHRRRTQPQGKNAGSMFKNPPQHSAGQLIEAAGGKGYRIGDVQISELHANFFLNLGSATAGDVLALVEWAKERVAETSGQQLELEVRVWRADA
ncbi:MAG: UDP-N-acetylmuramate dehydrogenase [Sulfobacillus sp.]